MNGEYSVLIVVRSWNGMELVNIQTASINTYPLSAREGAYIVKEMPPFQTKFGRSTPLLHVFDRTGVGDDAGISKEGLRQKRRYPKCKIMWVDSVMLEGENGKKITL